LLTANKMNDSVVRRRVNGAPKPRPQSMTAPSASNLGSSLSSLLRRSVADLRRPEIRDTRRVSLCLAAGYSALSPPRTPVAPEPGESAPVRRRPAPESTDSARKKMWRHSYAAGVLDRIGEEDSAPTAPDRRAVRRSGVAFAPTLALSPK
jgi:hypothetical protein